MAGSQLVNTVTTVVQGLHQLHRRTPLLVLIAGSVATGASLYALVALVRAFKSLSAPENDLPIGLPNPKNVCYLNAVLQAMSSNSTLVRFLKRSARLHPNKMLYCLVCILKGLRCTNRYITSNNLDGVLLEAHQMLLNELVESKRWSLDDQQDAPELFTYFMDVACSQSPGRTASKATEGLSLVSQLVGSRFEHAGPHCFHRGLVNGKSRTYAFRYPLRTDVFQRHLLANQVICTNCGYRSSPSLQAEACITLCLDPTVSVSNPSRGSRRRQLSHSRCSPRCPSLSDYLSKEFGTSERLNDFLCPECQKTERRSCATSTNYCLQERWIAHLPSCLVIHVQRGEWMGLRLSNEYRGSWAGGAKKRSDYLSFPHHLNMTNFMLSSKNARSGSRQNSLGDRNAPVDSLDSHFRRHHSYTLRSVLVHQGESVHSGHYFAYRTWHRIDPLANRKRHFFARIVRSSLLSLTNFFRALPNNASVLSSPWIFTSDKQVFRVPPEEVQSSVAYLLFYEREPPHFRSSVTGSLSHRVSNYEDGSLSGPSRPYGLVSDETNRPVPWAHSGMDGDVCAESIGTDNANVTIRFDDGDEDDTEDEDEEDCDEEGEDSDVPSDFAEEEFTGSRAEVIRSLAMAAKRLQM